jgi:hypothetical protein
MTITFENILHQQVKFTLATTSLFQRPSQQLQSMPFRSQELFTLVIVFH